VNPSVIVVAGGNGTRMRSEIPKQFLLLQGRPVLMHTLERFAQAIPGIQLILVLPEAHFETWEALCNQHAFTLPHQRCAGGATRFHSVQQGLLRVKEGVVAVHDGVRPLVSTQTITTVFETAQVQGAAVPVIKANESMREISGNQSKALDRSRLRVVQTPQAFRYDWMRKAFDQPYHDTFTDCASVLEAAGFPIALCAGNDENIKLTRPMDLLLAEALLQRKAFED
jgi:2-C-methyl-D-erythritol 4-phosphate cytidylyltransferase